MIEHGFIYFILLTMVIDNQEKSFSSRIEQPINWDWRKIKELESNDWWKSYQFEMDDNTCTNPISCGDGIQCLGRAQLHYAG